jgi:hypothetical protein
MKTLVKESLIALVAVALSLITFYFMYGWYDVFPWAIAALITGYTSENRRDSIINGAILGYFIVLAYIFAGYKGKTDARSMVNFILLNVLFSLVGSIVCATGAFVSYWFKRRFSGKVV